jgi:hypothetical protein
VDGWNFIGKSERDHGDLGEASLPPPAIFQTALKGTSKNAFLNSTAAKPQRNGFPGFFII